MQSTYFSYDPHNGAFLGEMPADESPAEPGVWLLPAYGTWKPAPATMLENQTAYFLDDEWVIKTITPEQVDVAVMGVELETDEKVSLMVDKANLNIKQMAKALGFADAADAISYADEDSQKGLDANAFREWRRQVQEKLDMVHIHYAQHENEPMPTEEQFTTIFTSTPFNRQFKVEPAELDPLVVEANRIQREASEAHQAKFNAK